MLAAAVVALAGCAQQAQKVEAPQSAQMAPQAAPQTSAAVTEPAPGQPPSLPAREPEPELPNQDLTDTVLYEFLLAEIAAQRGNVGLAAQAYAELAKRTRDPRIARRATEIAVFARMGNAAIESARVWHDTEPNSQRPLQALSGLLVSAGRFDEALHAEGERAKVEADPAAEDGIGEDGEAVDFEIDGGVAKPGGVDAGVGPGGDVGAVGRGQDGVADFAGELPPEHGGGLIGQTGANSGNT